MEGERTRVGGSGGEGRKSYRTAQAQAMEYIIGRAEAGKRKTPTRQAVDRNKQWQGEARAGIWDGRGS